jgi:hypothetical protein
MLHAEVIEPRPKRGLELEGILAEAGLAAHA